MSSKHPKQHIQKSIPTAIAILMRIMYISSIVGINVSESRLRIFFFPILESVKKETQCKLEAYVIYFPHNERHILKHTHLLTFFKKFSVIF
jgi:hypothetical protein